MKRRTVQRNLIWGTVFAASAFGITQALAHWPGVISDAGLAWVGVGIAGVLMLLTMIFGFMLAIFPVLMTLFFRNVLTEEEKRGRYAIVDLFMIDEYK